VSENPNLLTAFVQARFAEADADRRAWLDEQCKLAVDAKADEARRRLDGRLCKRGHDDWGVKPSTGRRYCMTCNRLRMRDLRDEPSAAEEQLSKLTAALGET
jgi:hypothetical protein